MHYASNYILPIIFPIDRKQFLSYRFTNHPQGGHGHRKMCLLECCPCRFIETVWNRMYHLIEFSITHVVQNSKVQKCVHGQMFFMPHSLANYCSFPEATCSLWILSEIFCGCKSYFRCEFFFPGRMKGC